MNLPRAGSARLPQRKWEVILGGYQGWVNCLYDPGDRLLGGGQRPSPASALLGLWTGATQVLGIIFCNVDRFFPLEGVNNQQAKISYEIRFPSMFCGYVCRPGFAN